MKKLIALASVVVVVAGLTLSGVARGQNQAAPAEIPHKVGLIDMAHVFKNYKKFEAERESLKAEITKTDELAKQKAEQIKGLQTTLKDYKEGTPEYAAAEKQFLKATTEFEAFRKTQQREFLRKESIIYKKIYLEVSDIVERYATKFEYTLIIRFNRDDAESSDNPQEIMQRMNKQVVYFRASDDITDSVLEFLNKSYNRTAASAAPATGRATATKQQ